jgi:hypothetical protein
MQLNAPPKELSLAPISTIKRNLDRILGKDTWEGFELETISLELGFVFDELLADKINVIQLLKGSTALFCNDVLFFLHAVNVINNNVADFDTFPMPSSLEIAYAFNEVKSTFPDEKLKFGNGVLKTITFILISEGYSEALEPFWEMGVSSADLSLGQNPEDTVAKKTAIKKYIEAMKG